MSYWYEVFDNEQVQLATRRQAAKLTAWVVVGVLCTVAALIFGHAGYVSMPLAGVFFLFFWLAVVRVFARRMRRLRRVVWCLKLSDRHLVGYDYTRRKTVLDWTKLQRVEIGSEGLVLRGPELCFFEISHQFPDFAHLSHRILYYAEFYDVPIYVDGRPWQDVDVYHLFPFLDQGAAPSAPGNAPNATPF